MAESTRDKILQTAARIIHRKGFNHTGIQEILQEAGVPKGSFYFYFKSKEDLGLQVIDFFLDWYCRRADEAFQDLSRPPLQRMKAFLDEFKAMFCSLDFCCGCPVGNLAQEMGDLSPAFREKLRSAVDKMCEIHREILQEAKSAGHIPDDLDLDETARFIVSSWHGALVRMKIEKTADALENHSRFIFERVLQARSV
jgi:TetR/AcrR family transcriptional repressor of nem operon